MYKDCRDASPCTPAWGWIDVPMATPQSTSPATELQKSRRHPIEGRLFSPSRGFTSWKCAGGERGEFDGGGGTAASIGTSTERR